MLTEVSYGLDMTNATHHLVADLIDSAAYPSEVSALARKAVDRACALALLLSQSAEGVDLVSRGAQEVARVLAEQDVRATAEALALAAGLVAQADPLEDIGTSPLHESLAEARALYHEALAALGLDPLAVAC